MRLRFFCSTLLALVIAAPAGAGLWFQPANGPSGADVNALAPDGATLWAATYRGVWKLSAGAWSLDGLGDRTVTSVAVSGGVVWAAAADALYRRGADGSWTAETLPQAVVAPPVVLASDGTTLWGGGFGLLRRSGGGVFSVLPSPGPSPVTALAVDGAGLLVGLSSGVVERWNGASYAALGAAPGAAEAIQALLPYLGAVYAGTGRGLYAWTGAAWTVDAGLGIHDVRAISSAGGIVRVATTDAGVLRNPGSGWSNDRAGLLTFRTKAFATVGSDLYLGTGGGPVYRLSGSAWTDAAPGTLKGAEITDFVEDSSAPDRYPAVASRGAGFFITQPIGLPDGCGDVAALANAPQGQGYLLATGCGPMIGHVGFTPAGDGLPSGAQVASLAGTQQGVVGGTVNNGFQRFVYSSWNPDNGGLSDSSQVGLVRQVGSSLYAWADGRLVQRGSNGAWNGVGTGLPPGATVTALGGVGSPAFAGLATGGVYRRDGAGDWRADGAGLLSNQVFSVDVSAGRLYAAAGSGGVLAKVDGGFRQERFGLPDGVDARVVRDETVGAVSIDPYTSNVFVGTAGRGAFAAPTVSAVRTIPVVLDAIGATGTRFQTELVIGNAGAYPVDVELLFTIAPGFGATTPTQSTAFLSLAAGAELRAPDALQFLRSKGMAIPAATPTSAVAGVLGIVGLSSGIPSPAQTEVLHAIARTYTTGSAGGTYGLFYDAPGDIDTAEESAAVYGLRGVSGKARSNLALVHVASGRSADPITLSVQIYDAVGHAAGAPIPVTLAPGEWHQLNGILPLAGLPDGSFGYAKITRTAGIGTWIAYGVVNDAATSDGSYLAMQRPGGLAATRRQIVPVVLDLFGAAGSHYTTELTLVNDSPIATPVDLTFQPAPGFGTVSGSPAISVTVAAHAQVTLADVLQAFRDKGVGVPTAAQGGTAGTLSVLFRYLTSLDLGATLALARTTTPNTDRVTGGSFGLFYPAVAFGGGARSSAIVPALRQDAAARSNLAVVHVHGGSDLPLTVSAQLYDADTGTKVGNVLTATLQPGEWKQWSSVMSLAAVPAGVTRTYALITRSSGDDSFFAYAVQNDAVTSDGSYVAMIPADQL